MSFSFVLIIAFITGAVLLVSGIFYISTLGIESLPLIIIGTVVCAFAAWSYFGIKKKSKLDTALKNGKKIKAVIVDYEANYAAKINGFHAVRLICKSDQPEYTEKVFYSSNYYVTSVLSHIGETATVYIDKNNPQNYRVEIPSLEGKGYGPDNITKAVGILFSFIGLMGTLIGGSIAFETIIKGDSMWWNQLPMAGFNLLFGILGVLIILKAGNPKTERAMLLYTGEKLQGEIVDCKEQVSISVNGVHPFALVIQTTDENGRVRMYTEKNVFLGGDKTVKGSKIDVYVAKKGTRYYVDVPEFKKTLRSLKAV